MVGWKQAYADKHAKKLKTFLAKKARKAKAVGKPRAFKRLIPGKMKSKKKSKKKTVSKAYASLKKHRTKKDLSDRQADRQVAGKCPNPRPKYTCKKGRAKTGCTPKGQYRPCKR